MITKSKRMFRYFLLIMIVFGMCLVSCDSDPSVTKSLTPLDGHVEISSPKDVRQIHENQESLEISLSYAASSNAIIRYTIDGSSVNDNSQEYTAPFDITEDTIVKAKAFKNDSYSSTEESSKKYYKVTKDYDNIEELREAILQLIANGNYEADCNHLGLASSLTSLENLFNYNYNNYYIIHDDDNSIEFIKFNGDISAWDVSNVTNMKCMFENAYSFNQPLNNWDVSSVTDMSYMFEDAYKFNQPLNTWVVSSVTDMSYMFCDTLVFNQPLNKWDVSSVINMYKMFESSILFNQPLNNWVVSSVTDMSGMFEYAYLFNQPLNEWDVSSVTDMSDMFEDAKLFNQPLNTWDVSNVTDMSCMFECAISFDQDLTSWQDKFSNNVIEHYDIIENAHKMTEDKLPDKLK